MSPLTVIEVRVGRKSLILNFVLDSPPPPTSPQWNGSSLGGVLVHGQVRDRYKASPNPATSIGRF